MADGFDPTYLLGGLCKVSFLFCNAWAQFSMHTLKLKPKGKHYTFGTLLEIYSTYNNKKKKKKKKKKKNAGLYTSISLSFNSDNSLRKHAYPNILKSLHHSWKFSDKNSDICFIFLLKNIDCWYSLEPPHGYADVYLQQPHCICAFWLRNKTYSGVKFQLCIQHNMKHLMSISNQLRCENQMSRIQHFLQDCTQRRLRSACKIRVVWSESSRSSP